MIQHYLIKKFTDGSWDYKGYNKCCVVYILYAQLPDPIPLLQQSCYNNLTSVTSLFSDKAASYLMRAPVTR